MKYLVVGAILAVFSFGAVGCGGDPCAEVIKKFEAAAGKDAVAVAMKDKRYKRLFSNQESCKESLEPRNKSFFDKNVEAIKELGAKKKK